MVTVFKVADKVAAFKAKLAQWARRVDQGVFDMFQSLVGSLGETEPAPALSQLVRGHLTALSNEFERYFPASRDPRALNEWVRNPFESTPDHLSVQEEAQLIELANDGGLKTKFDKTNSLPAFWVNAKSEYPEIAIKALKTLLPFPTTYLCEAGFSAMTVTKTKLRNRLDISNTLRVSLSNITPRWDILAAGKQAQGIH